MTLNELKDLIIQACDNGFGDVDVNVVAQNDYVDDGLDVIGIRCVHDIMDGVEAKHVLIIKI